MSIIRGNAGSATAIERRKSYFASPPKINFSDKSELRRQLAEAAANTQASADAAAALRIARQGRRA